VILLSSEQATADVRPDGIWDYISPSRLNLWLKCPLAFRLRYVDRIRLPPTPALFLGTRVHDALELFYRHRQLGVALPVEAALQRIADTWEEAVEADAMRFDSVAAEQALKEQAAGLVRLYLTQLADSDEIPLAVETTLQEPLVDPFGGEDLGIPLLGVLDLILDDRDGPVICDFKTAAKSAAPFEVTHEIQLSCYSYLYRWASGRDEGGLEIRSLIKTKTPKLDFHLYEPRSPRHFRRLFAAIRSYLDDLDSGTFVFRPGLGCGMCEYRDDYCQRWMG
jgi:putative RecB family exonuclease